MKNLFAVPYLKLLAAFLLLLTDLPSTLSSLSQGTKLPLMTSDVREVSGKSFDYIVVGGGTTGCALAATLSERFSVLLVERGGSPFKNPQVTEKKYYGLSLLKPDKYTSVAQDFVSKEGVQNLRGRVLGGSSAINGGFYSRASWDFVKKAGWDKGLVMNAYKWVESKIVFRPFLSPWQWVAEFGLLEAGILPCNGYSLEHIEGTKIGGTIFDEHGRRHTSADLLEAANINNIFVLLNATVKSVIFQKNGNRSRHIAHGIKFMKSHGSTHEVYEAYLKQPQNSSVRGDVILTAGAIGSPQILMLSGVGPFNHLKNFKIPLVLDLKGVGERMKDSPGVSVLVDPRPQNRLPDTPEVVGIAENLKYIIQTGILPISLNETRIPIAIKYSFPASKGKLRLKSTDPRNNPSVSFNYLSNEKDLKECSKMTRLLQRVARTHSVAMFFGIKRNNKYMLSGENELIKFCKDNVRTFYHYFGGCTVGSVVDKDYKVDGVRGLRVVDGSTFLESPGTNPMATLLMLGRYQGIKILEERKHASGSTSH